MNQANNINILSLISKLTMIHELGYEYINVSITGDFELKLTAVILDPKKQLPSPPEDLDPDMDLEDLA